LIASACASSSSSQSLCKLFRRDDCHIIFTGSGADTLSVTHGDWPTAQSTSSSPPSPFTDSWGVSPRFPMIGVLPTLHSTFAFRQRHPMSQRHGAGPTTADFACSCGSSQGVRSAAAPEKVLMMGFNRHHMPKALQSKVASVRECE
jgi:hypothetical protein